MLLDLRHDEKPFDTNDFIYDLKGIHLFYPAYSLLHFVTFVTFVVRIPRDLCCTMTVPSYASLTFQHAMIWYQVKLP